MNKKDESIYHLGFSYCYGIGPLRFSLLVKNFGNVKTAYEANKNDLAKIIGTGWAEKFVAFRQKFDPSKKLEELKKKNIMVIPACSDDYPFNLKNISDPPICIYIKGSLDSLKSLNKNKQAIAIVGTRQPTPYGQQIAKKFAGDLARDGFTIVSGMALGIDAAAHWACLNNGGKTIAVLGCGVDVVYPSYNQRLYDEIIKNNSVVISEFPAGQFVVKGLFVARNRIISALANGVLIVEGLKDSGSLITARYAAEQGKEVFAPPCPITSVMSEAPNMLLKQGAKLVTTVEDIYEELNIKMHPVKKDKTELLLDDHERVIFAILQNQESLTIDELTQKSGSAVDDVLSIISSLEIKGLVEKNNEGKYQLIN